MLSPVSAEISRISSNENAPFTSSTTITAPGPELVALIGAHRIRLGAPTQMEAKAVALVAVLADERLALDATIDLVAPSRPAVSAPAPPATPAA